MITAELEAHLRLFEEAHFAVLAAEEAYKTAKEYYRTLAERDIPEAMESAGLKSAVTKNGFTVTLGDEIHVNEPAIKDRSAIIAWLDANGFGSMVKWDFTMSFGAKEDKQARAFAEMVKKLFPTRNIRVVEDCTNDDLADLIRRIAKEAFPDKVLKVEQKVHLTTLKNFILTTLRAGRPLPDIFGYYAPREAKLSLPQAASSTDEDLIPALSDSIAAPRK